jgi:hypothetical protein
VISDTLPERGPEITTTSSKETIEIKEEYKANSNESPEENETIQKTTEDSYLNQSVDTELKELPLNEVIENELEDNLDFNEPVDTEFNEMPSIDIID